MADDIPACNREEGLKCLGIAQRSLASGDKDKALRFAEKAARIYPSEEVKSFLNSVQHHSTTSASRPTNGYASPANENDGQPNGMGSSSGLHQRGSHRRPFMAENSGRSTAGEAPAVQRVDDSQATLEQRTLVTTILSKKCYYEILSVSRTAGEDDIKRSYRKLALKLHPDKNKAARADDAFKAVSKAFTCLSNPTKRQHYDAYGNEEPAGVAMGRQGGFHTARGGRGGGGLFDDDIDPEEIFRMFFGGNPFMSPAAQVFTFGGGGAGLRRRQAHAHQQQQAGNANNFRPLFSLLPFMLLLLFNIISNPSKPPFSLTKSRQHPISLATSAHGVPYFVSSTADFTSKYPVGSRERLRMELQIEADWKEEMQRACYNERLLRHRYEYFGQKDRAAQVSMASCEALAKKFQSGVSGDTTRKAGSVTS